MVADCIQDMGRQLAQMNRTYNNYIKHGAVNAAGDLLEEIGNLESSIQCGDEVYRMAFH